MNNEHMNPTQRVLDALEECGNHATRSGKGWSARCPAHDDRNPSLSISEGSEGQALVHCHAGCGFDDIVEAIGLQTNEMFPVACDTSRVSARSRPQSVARDTGRAWKPTPKPPAIYPNAHAALSAVEAMIGSSVDCSWEYHDPQGELIGVILRFDLPDGKQIRPISLHVSGQGGGWVLGGMPAPKPLYALREIIDSSEVVYVCEGEKACDAARAIGLVATTSPHGAQSASKADWSVMRGRSVVILPDHDDAGERYASDVVELLHEAGAARVRIVRLAELWDELSAGGDLADVMEIEGGDVNTVLEGVERLTDGALDIENQAGQHANESDEFMPFPVESFPEPIRSYVIQGAAAIGCDPSFMALPMLSALASAIGNTRRVQLKRTWTEPAIVWTAIVGESGTAKSPAMEQALRCVRQRQINDMRAYKAELEQWESDHAIWEARQSKWKQAAASGKTTETIPEPVRPICRRTWTDDATIEALVGKLMENPRGLLMVRDELSGWFSFGRYASDKGGSEVAHWLELFGGREMIVDRKGSGTEYVPRASVSIAGGIQPELLRKSLTDTNRENGLAARILYAMPPREQKRWSDEDINADIEARVAEVFEHLYTLEPETDADDPSNLIPKLITLDADAKARWIRFVNEHGYEQMELTGDQAAAWSKLEGYAARFALINHQTRIASGDQCIADPVILDLESLEAGITMVGWFARETKRVYARLVHAGSEESAHIRKQYAEVIKWIRSKGSQTTARDLSRGPDECRPKGKAKSSLEELVRAGLGRWESGSKGRTHVFHLIE